MIYLQLGQISHDSAIQPNWKPVATLYLWTTWVELSNEPWQLDEQSPTTQYSELWDQIHVSNPTLAVIYLDVLLSYTNVNLNQVTEGPGSEQVARLASLCLLHVLSGVGPASVVTQGVRQHYLGVIPQTASFGGLQFYNVMNAIHAILFSSKERLPFQWAGYNPYPQEHIFFANNLVQIAHLGKEQLKKVPRWILRFVLHSLSQDPLPPTSIIINCLSIIAIDLDCDISGIRTTTLDAKYVHTQQMTISLTQNQCAIGGGLSPDNSKTQNHDWSCQSGSIPFQAQGYYCTLPTHSLARVS